MKVRLWNGRTGRGALSTAAVWGPDGWVLAGADLRELVTLITSKPGDHLELFPVGHDQRFLQVATHGEVEDRIVWRGPAFDENGPVEELRDNNAAVKEHCAICGRQFKPFIGDWPFLKGTWSPICEEEDCR
jgi:hypothetical protein